MIGGVVPRSCIVLDMDPRHGGNLAELEKLVGPLPTTLTTISGRPDGGKHFWFRLPLGEICRTRLPAGWDLKVNGYLMGSTPRWVL
jgi:Bifunctional DNA primase/polymerase, N-terminal